VVKEIRELDDFIGRFEAVDQVDVRARVSGYLDEVHFTDGASVKEGDLLFTIDRRNAQATVDQAQATLDSAKAQLDFATTDLERGEELRETGTISEQVTDQRRQAFLTAKGEHDRAEAALAQARLDLEFTEVKAPIAGRISRRLVSRGNLVNADQTVLTNIVSLDPIQFYFDVDERSYLAYSRMAEGMRPSGGRQRQRGPRHPDERAGRTRRGRMDFADNRLRRGERHDPRPRRLRQQGPLPHPGNVRSRHAARLRRVGGVLVPDEALGSDQDRRGCLCGGAWTTS
jgi:RND family efflux transporter MFP subunit